MENKTHKKMKTPVSILLLVVLALAVAASGFGIYFAVSDGFGPAEPPVDLVKAEADFRAQMADSSVQEVTLPVDLVLTSPVEVSGNKVITGEGSLTAAKEMKGNYLYLALTNTAGGKKKQHFRTTKGEGHGFGIARIDAIVKKYGGYVTRASEDGAFSTEVLLPQ